VVDSIALGCYPKGQTHTWHAAGALKGRAEKGGLLSGYSDRAESGWSELSTPNDMHKDLHYSASCQMSEVTVSSNFVSMGQESRGLLVSLTIWCRSSTHTTGPPCTTSNPSQVFTPLRIDASNRDQQCYSNAVNAQLEKDVSIARVYRSKHYQAEAWMNPLYY
jgi:hypothetical protein